jgi:hypothetical protein
MLGAPLSMTFQESQRAYEKRVKKPENYFSELMSITNRYFTSLRSMRS